VDQTRWEHALHETKGLGNWRRDLPLLVGIAVATFVALRLIGSGDTGSSVISAVLVAFGVLVVLPLFELLSNYRRAPAVTEETAAETERAEGEEPEHAERERERYESLRNRLEWGQSGPGEGPRRE
jgi:hypothetical protein